MKRAARHIRALTIGRECVALGARARTVEQITGLPGAEIRRLFFTEAETLRRGRAPSSANWYHHANVLTRAEASIFVSVYRRTRTLGFNPSDALIAAFKHYLKVACVRPRIDFDRAFDLASNVDGIWLCNAPSLMLATCPGCESEYVTAVGTAPSTNSECPFCKLLKRYPRDAELQASFPGKTATIRSQNIGRAAALAMIQERQRGRE